MVVWTSGKCIEFIKEYQKKIYVIFIQRFSVSPNKFWMAYFFQWNGKKFIFYKFIFENILFCLSYPPFFFQSVQTSEFNWMKYYHSFYYKFAMTRRNEVIQCDYVKVHLIYTKHLKNKWDIFWNIQCHENEHRSVTQTRTINFRFDSCIGFAMRSHPIRLTLYNRRSCRPEFIILSTPPGNSIIIPRTAAHRRRQKDLEITGTRQDCAERTWKCISWTSTLTRPCPGGIEITAAVWANRVQIRPDVEYSSIHNGVLYGGNEKEEDVSRQKTYLNIE